MTIYRCGLPRPTMRGMAAGGDQEWVRWPDLDAEQKRARLGTVIHVVTMLACVAFVVALIVLAVWAAHRYGWLGPDGSPTR